MTTKTIFVVFGNIGHGKTTFANMIADITNGKVMSFADAVKQVGKAMVGIPLEISHGTQDDKANNFYYGKSARHWLQLIGTEMGRDSVSKTVWVDRFLDRAIADENPVIISGDGRFPEEEYVYLKEQAEEREVPVYGIIIRRPGYAVDKSHRSESVIAETPDNVFDATIENDADLVALGNAAEELIDIIDESLIALPNPFKGITFKNPPKYIPKNRHGNYIWLQSGRPFWPLDPHPEDFTLKDIAFGAAYENRWHGQTRTPINVANHSNNVRKLVMVIAPIGLKALAGLYAQFHDAHEGLLKDIAKPLKEMFPGWSDMEKEVDLAIRKHFGMDPEVPDSIKTLIETCDNWMAGVEARAYHCLQNKDLARMEPPPTHVLLASGVEIEQDPRADALEFIRATGLLLQACNLPHMNV